MSRIVQDLETYENVILNFFSGGGSYNSGLDLKRHIEEQSMDSPLSGTDNQDSLQEPDMKRSRQEQHYETE